MFNVHIVIFFQFFLQLSHYYMEIFVGKKIKMCTIFWALLFFQDLVTTPTGYGQSLVTPSQTLPDKEHYTETYLTYSTNRFSHLA